MEGGTHLVLVVETGGGGGGGGGGGAGGRGLEGRVLELAEHAVRRLAFGQLLRLAGADLLALLDQARDDELALVRQPVLAVQQVRRRRPPARPDKKKVMASLINRRWNARALLQGRLLRSRADPSS